MYKHRDNIAYAPTTIDPSGSGQRVLPTVTNSTGPTPLATDTARPSAATLAPTVAGARKRVRDIRGIDRFRQVVYGENGFPRLHAMATRCPTLMYPPEGIQEARQRFQQRKDTQQPVATDTRAGLVEGPRAHSFEADDESLWAMFEERRHAEEGEALSTTDAPTTAGPPLESGAPGLSAADALRDELLAHYHHKQLEAFLRLVYEFNHTTFVKLPIQDTLSLLSRCGKEAVAHVLEYETALRMAREGKLRELRELKDMRDTLRRRMDAVEQAREERALAEAERVQAMLDGVQETDDVVGEGRPEDVDGAHEGRDASAAHVCFAGVEEGGDGGEVPRNSDLHSEPLPASPLPKTVAEVSEMPAV